jgi:Family of unknown function (DUF6011)
MISEIKSAPSPAARIEALVAATGGKNSFVQSLVAQFTTKGSLSEKQWVWVDKLTNEAKPAAPKEDASVPGLWTAFAAAAHLDNEWPQVQILAGEGRVRAMLCKGAKGDYLKLSYTEATKAKAFDWAYVGIALPDDSIRRKGAHRAFDAIIDALSEFGDDAVGTLAAFGKTTGVCGCCGRTLTDPLSVQRGIGPICWGRLGVGK